MNKNKDIDIHHLQKTIEFYNEQKRLIFNVRLQEIFNHTKTVTVHTRNDSYSAVLNNNLFYSKEMDENKVRYNDNSNYPFGYFSMQFYIQDIFINFSKYSNDIKRIGKLYNFLETV